MGTRYLPIGRYVHMYVRSKQTHYYSHRIDWGKQGLETRIRCNYYYKHTCSAVLSTDNLIELTPIYSETSFKLYTGQ